MPNNFNQQPNQRLKRARLQELLDAERIDDLQVSEIFDLFASEEALKNHAPDAICQMDPRDKALVLYNSSRATRPHDNTVPLIEEPDQSACPICQGTTTGVIDVADLSQGFTFINKNLFPILHKAEGVAPDVLRHSPNLKAPITQGQVAYGLHFLQWTSSYHHLDWHNMPPGDRTTVMARLAALEKKLLFGAEMEMPASNGWENGKNAHGFVSVIKNYGRLVGGSLAHGHQQIGFSNVMPQRFALNYRFLQDHGETFADFMLRENPDMLQIKDYGEAVLLVPYFMKRPYNMMLVVKNTERQYLCELNQAELTAMGDGWHDAIHAMLTIMPQMNKDAAYNIVMHNGPGAGLYVEFLPYTQETGGFEQLGLWVCHGRPELAAAHLREMLQIDPRLEETAA